MSASSLKVRGGVRGESREEPPSLPPTYRILGIQKLRDLAGNNKFGFIRGPAPEKLDIPQNALKSLKIMKFYKFL